MKWIARWLVVCVVVSGSPAWAQGQGDGRPREADPTTSVSSDDEGKGGMALVWTGLISTAVGLSLVLHWNETDVRVLNTQYCVGERTVDYGTCGTPQETKIGLIMIGGGILAMWGGYKIATHVSVRPELTHTRKQVTARIAW